MKDINLFLQELSINNNREWFAINKERYIACKVKFEEFAASLIEGISCFDADIGFQNSKNCCYRIYRDIRFSPNKDPYKTWMGAYICYGGKKSGLPGYYFHIEPENASYIGYPLLSVGLHAPDAPTLKKIRQGIVEDGERFQNAVTKAATVGFAFDTNSMLRRVPSIYPANHPQSDFLKVKDPCISTSFSLTDFGDNKELLEYALNAFSIAADFCKILKDYVTY